jgi:adenylate cyclase
MWGRQMPADARPVARQSEVRPARLRARRALAGALPGLLVTLVVALLHWADTGALRQAGLLLFDAYQRAAPRAYAPVPVRIIDIDDETIARAGQWPWPRLEIARLLESLAESGAAVVAFDIVFSEPDRTSPARLAGVLAANPAAQGPPAGLESLADHDEVFAASLRGAPAVLGFFLAREPGPPPPPRRGGIAFGGTPPATIPVFGSAISPLPLLAEAADGTGFLTMTGDRDGIVRRAPLLGRVGEEIVPSLALEALRVAQGAGAITIRSSDASGELGGRGRGGGGGGQHGV